ncbi:poly [ADP-ribose] polymerase-like [Sitodiplosis mosellana]|uniref:poly [ADP-ribose] polymerase-like n=1 Tax=Sitodiplosis mosellana TaxID=263140 RepID=UPI00244506DA|nr:poly [ADP-ribose] polymerase-like [Sitodiplosis mosellana]
MAAASSTRLDAEVKELMKLLINREYISNISAKLGTELSYQIEQYLEKITKCKSKESIAEASKQFDDFCDKLSFQDAVTKRNFLNVKFLLELSKHDPGTNVFVECYKKLNTKIVPLDRNSKKFRLLCRIARDTHGPSHNVKLEVQQIYKFERERECQRFPEPYSDPRGHRLLWHGTRLTNIAAILKFGLQVPKEGETGKSYFGNGIYFADVVSKSTRYCIGEDYNNIGLIFLCEVALGKSLVKTHAENTITNIPNDVYQSIRAFGQFFPHSDTRIDGVKIKSGDIRTQTEPRFEKPLKYNEFVVYDPAQVKLKYLLQIKMRKN